MGPSTTKLIYIVIGVLVIASMVLAVLPVGR